MAPAEDVRIAILAFFSAVVVVGAVTVEVLAGAAANTLPSSWAARFVPLAWPQLIRAGWWLVVAAAALSFRLSLRRLGFRQRPWVIVGSVAPFLIFAGGVAAGAEWAAWH